MNFTIRTVNGKTTAHGSTTTKSRMTSIKTHAYSNFPNGNANEKPIVHLKVKQIKVRLEDEITEVLKSEKKKTDPLAWEGVHDLLKAIGKYNTYADPLEEFCYSNPSDLECRCYEI